MEWYIPEFSAIGGHLQFEGDYRKAEQYFLEIKKIMSLSIKTRTHRAHRVQPKVISWIKKGAVAQLRKIITNS